MCVALVVLLSVAVLHSASAGGAYCSKTAAARAAALGLPYPGHHGAPDLSGAHMIYPRSNYDVTTADPDWTYYQQGLPRARSSVDINPRSSGGFHLGHAFYPQVPSGYTSGQMLSFPEATLSDYPGTHFREVKHVAPPVQDSSSGLPELTFWAPRGYSQPHVHVYSEQPPIGYDASLGGLGQTRSAGHADDQSDSADASFDSDGAEPRGFRHLKKVRHIPAVWKFLRGPVQHVFRDFYYQPFVHGKAHVKRI